MQTLSMKQIICLISVVLLLSIPACVSKGPEATTARWQPWHGQISNQEELNEALKARWPLNLLRTYCKAIPPTPGSFQNLVALGKSWEGTLYVDGKTGFDKVWWYASLEGNKLDQYSLNATKGTNNWIVELGNLRTLVHPPRIPDYRTQDN